MRSSAMSSLRREPRGRPEISMMQTPIENYNPPDFPALPR
jgi:hypothetical protein